jgi:hypothetical protein
MQGAKGAIDNQSKLLVETAPELGAGSRERKFEHLY